MDIVTSNNNNKTDNTELKHPDSLVDLKPTVKSAPLVPETKQPITNIVITQEHKNEFLRCLATGDRYTEEFSLFGGSISLKIRCRTIEESDALMSYLRQQSLTGNIKTDYEYQSALRLVLLVSQVEKLNDIEFKEMEKPLLYTVEGTTMVPPAWVSRIDYWKGKPESVVSAVSTAIAEFEARYWEMIKASSDINFWQPGRSTGQ